jgi:histidinol-phosphate aminotransferase
MRVKEQITNLKRYQAGKPIEEVKKELGLTEVIKLASNENPFGCSQLVKEAVLKVSEDLSIYPDSIAAELRHKISELLHIQDEEILIGNGSDEIIQLLCRGILQQGDNCVMATPTFPNYKHNCLIEGAEAREVPLKDGTHDLDKMIKQVDKHTKIIWICNPNNPSGTYVNEKALVSFLEKVPSTSLVVIDEAYVEYASATDFPDSLSLIKRFNNVLLLRTFSKAYGLAALRVGYAIGQPSLLNQIDILRAPFNCGRMGQAVAARAIDDQNFIRETFLKNVKGLNMFYQFCDAHGLHYYPSQTNFILMSMNRSGEQIFQELLHQGIIIRPGERLGFPNYVRITVGTLDQNEKVISCLSKLMK